jgi:hypothetical protein
MVVDDVLINALATHDLENPFLIAIKFVEFRNKRAYMFLVVEKKS